MSNVGPYGNYQAELGPHPDALPALITFTIPLAGNPNDLAYVATFFPAMSLNTDDGSLWVTLDGSNWTEITGGGGTGVKQVYFGHGSPVGVVSANATGTQGIIYYDLDTGIIYEKNGTGTSGWF